MTASSVPWTLRGVLALNSSAVPWTFTKVLALDSQCSPLDLHQSAGPWLPVQSPGPSPECWPLIASAVPWTFTRVLAFDCQCSPLDLHQSAGLWLPVQSPGPSPECWPMISSAVVWFPSWVWMLRMAIIHALPVRVYSGSFKLQWELEMHLQNSVPVKWSAAYLSLSLDSC